MTILFTSNFVDFYILFFYSGLWSMFHFKIKIADLNKVLMLWLCALGMKLYLKQFLLIFFRNNSAYHQHSQLSQWKQLHEFLAAGWLSRVGIRRFPPLSYPFIKRILVHTPQFSMDHFFLAVFFRSLEWMNGWNPATCHAFDIYICIDFLHL